MPDVKFTSGLDDRGFKRGISGIQHAAQVGATRVGQQFTKSFNQQVSKYLGVGFLIASVKSLTIALEKAQKLKLESITTGMSPERLQAMAILAEKFGAAWEKLDDITKIELADFLIQTGDAAIDSANRVDKMSNSFGKLEFVIGKVKNAAMGLFGYLSDKAVTSPAINALVGVASFVRNLGDMDKVKADIFKFQKGTQGPQNAGTFETIGERIKSATKANESKAASERATRLSPVAPMARQTDSLQRIGLFVGGAGNPAIAIGREQLQVLRQILVLQRQTLQETKRL
jgi:hypothetical protein